MTIITILLVIILILIVLPQKDRPNALRGFLFVAVVGGISYYLTPIFVSLGIVAWQKGWITTGIYVVGVGVCTATVGFFGYIITATRWHCFNCHKHVRAKVLKCKTAGCDCVKHSSSVVLPDCDNGHGARWRMFCPDCDSELEVVPIWRDRKAT